MPAKLQKKCRNRVTLTRTSEVLDVRMAAELFTVSPDTVYDLFKRGELPGRKVERGDRHVIATALKSGKAQIKKR